MWWKVAFRACERGSRRKWVGAQTGRTTLSRMASCQSATGRLAVWRARAGMEVSSSKWAPVARIPLARAARPRGTVFCSGMRQAVTCLLRSLPREAGTGAIADLKLAVCTKKTCQSPCVRWTWTQKLSSLSQAFCGSWECLTTR